MHTYEVSIYWNGRNFGHVVRAYTAADAIVVAQRQYIGCRVFSARIIG